MNVGKTLPAIIYMTHGPSTDNSVPNLPWTALKLPQRGGIWLKGYSARFVEHENHLSDNEHKLNVWKSINI